MKASPSIPYGNYPMPVSMAQAPGEHPHCWVPLAREAYQWYPIVVATHEHERVEILLANLLFASPEVASNTPVPTVPESDAEGSYSVSWTAVGMATGHELEERAFTGSWSQAHGGIGYTWEYPLHIWLKRAIFDRAHKRPSTALSALEVCRRRPRAYPDYLGACGCADRKLSG